MRIATSLLFAASIALTAQSLVAVPAIAAAHASTPTHKVVDPAPVRDLGGAPDHTQHKPLPIDERPPLPASNDEARRDYDAPDTLKTEKRPSLRHKAAAAAECVISEFTGKTGAALIAAIKAADTACINKLFALTGGDAGAAFGESKMVIVADAYRANAATYPGENSTSTTQLVLYLRAGYYVQWYHPDDVGPYGDALKNAIKPALEAFFANSHSGDVSDANGETLSESIILIDSARQNADFLPVVKRFLNAFDKPYLELWWMRNAVNSVFTVLFRGHQLPEFVSAVQADNSVLGTLHAFAAKHLDLLGTESAFLTVNAGRELGRFLQHASLLPSVKPQVISLLKQTSITGPTVRLWVGLAEMADAYDKAKCVDYGVCDLRKRVKGAVLPVAHTCGATLRIVGQEISSEQLAGACTSMQNQDAFFHGLVKDPGPVANDNNTTLEVVVFNSSTDYQTYAGVIYGIDTNNGGMYLEGDPGAAGNQPRFIAYEAEWKRPAFEIWNLNHEYTHYLDGRFDMFGDFAEGMKTPTVWWVEGVAEYVSYSYRKLDNTNAAAEAGKHTYPLSAMFDTVYGDGQTRIYSWGYLAVRYMFEKNPAEVSTLLGHYRKGEWDTARAFLKSLNHNSEFGTWLNECAAGACGGEQDPSTPCAAQDTRAMGRDCTRSDIAGTKDGYAYFYIRIPEGVKQLKITSTGGTGDADLYFNKSGWATTQAHQSRSTNPGNNETLTVTDLAPGTDNFISLHGVSDFSGIRLTTEY
ncbi:M9 family metallopeptidase [Nonomuraea sp. NPDC049400]|uniref:M9 family metallopeptidase n=1 Tax=Nonomuraea sp. NPDC049400 TaxID=3364352 RepID=UPI003792BBE6